MGDDVLLIHLADGNKHNIYFRPETKKGAAVRRIGVNLIRHKVEEHMRSWRGDTLLRRVLDIHYQIDSSQCLAQLTPARVGKARSVHVQLGASPHVIR